MQSPLLKFVPYGGLAEAVGSAGSLPAGTPAACRPDGRLAGGGPAGWQPALLVSSGGVADAIRRELLRRSPAGIAGVSLLTLESLARVIVNEAGEYPRVAGDAERRLAMRTAVRSIDDPIMESRGIAAMLERSYRDVRDSGRTLADFDATIRATGGLRNAARTRLLLRAWREYERVIARMGAIDPADLLTRAAALVAKSTIAPQAVAGFYDMTGVQFALVEALHAAGKLVGAYVPITSGDVAYRFADDFVKRVLGVGCQVSAPTPDTQDPTPWSITQHTTRQTELHSVCAEIHELLATGTPASSIGIVARALDAYDVSLLNRFAAEHGFRTSRADETPLPAHPLGRGIALLLRLRERGFPRAEVLELVRDGFVPRARIDVDATDLATRRARIAGGTTQELRAVHRRQHVDDYLALVAELETLTEPLATPMRGSEWSEALGRLTARFKLTTAADLVAAEAIDELTALFRRAGDLRFDATAILDALEQHSISQHPTPGTQHPLIWLGDVMKFRGRSFEHLFAVRMQEDFFPQRRVEDPLLPDSDRRLVGLREVGNGRDEEQLLFRLLFDATKQVHFHFAGTDGFGKILRPSPLLKQFLLGQRPDEKANILRNFSEYTQTSRQPSTDNRQPPRTRALQLLTHSGTNSTFDGYVTSEALRPIFAKALQSVSPTHLEDFGECPQKFLLKHVLGVRDIDDPERELQINHRDKGTLDHHILERFYAEVGQEELDRAATTLPRLPDDLQQRLDALVDEEFDRLEAIAPPFNRTMRDIERRATRRVLQEFVAVDFAELIANGLAPQRVEYCFGPKYVARGHADHDEPFIVNAGGIPIRVEGRIDRIDAGDGRYRIVDYKSGKALRHKDLGSKIDRGVRLQLALYAMAVAEFFGADAASIGGAIKPLVISETKAEHFAFALGEKQQRLQETLDLFAEAILRGAFPAFPNEKDEDFNSCKYCPVNHSCRTKHDPDEKYAVMKSREPRTLLSEERRLPAGRSAGSLPASKP